ncbi:1,4-dihydroxy-2-naphthoate octaprenyltransferase [Bifidobacterium xylocopae]|uniref:1,4-dihydroxy-2-naphthoate octaprenyltransferase n=1 Tax=Bifidobacterium xylocopae TaxID=2493119 RepID=A0A366KEG5_9BIFI|nr:1,4-dihydroxy-2-naphthoate octaprenyltransferase [Bifidobacterium xylocopae]RBP99787.1 1,4-dihydroxy-2-naphthoate octaprenyltransferase [Bifidobacterium xylocopae]
MNVKLWINGMRPKTLPASVAPVCVGAAAALVHRSKTAVPCASTCAADAPIQPTAQGAAAQVGAGQLWTVFILLVLLALFMQVAANFANDYSDGIRGTDAKRGDEEEVSGKPRRLVASGVAPRKVFAAMTVSVLITALLGLAAVAITGHWWMIAAGLACFAAGWFYTGGKHPYGYYGLGEVFVFIFFGLVATLGTEYFMVGALSGDGWAGACAAGLNAVGLLMLNNYRDIESDRRSGKHTYATLVGDHAARVSIYVVYAVSLLLAVMEFGGVFWRFGSMNVPAVIVVVPIAVCFGFIFRFFARHNQPKAFVLSGQGTLISALCWTVGLLMELV